MSLEHRSGKWHICYYPQGRVGGKKRLPIPGVTSKEEAQVVHDSFMAKNRPSGAAGYTVGQLWPEYMVWYKMHRAATTYKDITLAGNHFLKYFGSDRVGDINQHHITLYKKLRLGDIKTKRQTNIHRSINKELAYFSGFLKYCRTNYSVGEKFQIIPLPYKRPDPVILSVKEVHRLIRATEREPFYKALFLCLYTLGLRINEARNIRVNDIDWSRNTLKVIQKGSQPKTLPVGTTLVSSLKEIAPPRSSWRVNPLMFASPTSQKGKKAKPIFDIRKALKRACTRARITKKVTPHTFRHTCLTHLTMGGINASIVQRYAGHKEISTTQHYVHLSTEHLKKASSVIEDMLDLDYNAVRARSKR